MDVMKDQLVFGYANWKSFTDKSPVFDSEDSFREFIFDPHISFKDAKTLNECAHSLIQTINDRIAPVVFTSNGQPGFSDLLLDLDQHTAYISGTNTHLAAMYKNIADCLYEAMVEKIKDGDSANYGLWLRPRKLLNYLRTRGVENPRMYGLANPVTFQQIASDALVDMVGKLSNIKEELTVEQKKDLYHEIRHLDMTLIRDGVYRDYVSSRLSGYIDFILGYDASGMSCNAEEFEAIAFEAMYDRIRAKISNMIDDKYYWNEDFLISVMAALMSNDVEEFKPTFIRDAAAFMLSMMCCSEDSVGPIDDRLFVLAEKIIAIARNSIDPYDTKNLNIIKIRSLADDINEEVQRQHAEERERLNNMKTREVGIHESTYSLVTPEHVQALTTLELFSFNHISDDPITITLEATRSEGHKDAVNAKNDIKHTMQKGAAKIYRGYDKFQSNTKKVGDSVDKLTTKVGRWAANLDEDRIRDEVIEGKRTSPMRVLSAALKTVAIFSVSKLAGLITVVAHFYCHKKISRKERARVIAELEQEIEILDEKIADANGDGNRKAKYNMMRTRANLKSALQKIRMGEGGSAKAVKSAKLALNAGASLSFGGKEDD